MINCNVNQGRFPKEPDFYDQLIFVQTPGCGSSYCPDNITMTNVVFDGGFGNIGTIISSPKLHSVTLINVTVKSGFFLGTIFQMNSNYLTIKNIIFKDLAYDSIGAKDLCESSGICVNGVLFWVDQSQNIIVDGIKLDEITVFCKEYPLF